MRVLIFWAHDHSGVQAAGTWHRVHSHAICDSYRCWWLFAATQDHFIYTVPVHKVVKSMNQSIFSTVTVAKEMLPFSWQKPGSRTLIQDQPCSHTAHIHRTAEYEAREQKNKNTQLTVSTSYRVHPSSTLNWRGHSCRPPVWSRVPTLRSEEEQPRRLPGVLPSPANYPSHPKRRCAAGIRWRPRRPPSNQQRWQLPQSCHICQSSAPDHHNQER